MARLPRWLLAADLAVTLALVAIAWWTDDWWLLAAGVLFLFGSQLAYVALGLRVLR